MSICPEWSAWCHLFAYHGLRGGFSGFSGLEGVWKTPEDCINFIIFLFQGRHLDPSCMQLSRVYVTNQCILKEMAKLFKIVIFNPLQSSPSSAILVPFCSRANPLVIFFLSKQLFVGLTTLKLKNEFQLTKAFNSRTTFPRASSYEPG